MEPTLYATIQQKYIVTSDGQKRLILLGTNRLRVGDMGNTIDSLFALVVLQDKIKIDSINSQSLVDIAYTSPYYLSGDPLFIEFKKPMDIKSIETIFSEIDSASSFVDFYELYKNKHHSE